MIYFKNILPAFVLIISFASIELEKKVILDNKVEILIPKGWKALEEDKIKMKYPGARPPQLVFCDATCAISLAFNYTDSKASPASLEKYRESLKNSLENSFPNAMWEESGLKEINGKKVGFFRLTTDTPKERIYNYMVFTDLDGRLLVCTFNCVEKKLKEWRPVAQEIMNSLTVK